MSKSGGGKSLTWMIATLMLAIAAIAWGLAASDYAVAVEGELPEDVGLSYRRARGAFIGNAFEEIPNAPQVIAHTFSNARWIVYVFGGLELGAVIFGIAAWKLGRSFDDFDNRHKKKRRV